MGEAIPSENLEDVRRAMGQAVAHARETTRKITGAGINDAPKRTRSAAKGRLEAAKARAQQRLKKPPLEMEEASDHLSLVDRHTLDLLLSHIRHSVVRMCFYNLRLFCPSLVDEFDEEVRTQVLSDIGALGQVRETLERFFAYRTARGTAVAQVFSVEHDRCLTALTGIEHAAEILQQDVEDPERRRQFALVVPREIDDVMNALHAVQEFLDDTKVDIAETVRQALQRAKPLTDSSGVRIECNVASAPHVYADEQRIQDAVCELIRNAIHHGAATEITARVGLCETRATVEIQVYDNGSGMTEEVMRRCRERGFSTGGTGEGLPMVVTIAIDEHLGDFDIARNERGGCTAVIALPIKYTPGKSLT